MSNLTLCNDAMTRLGTPFVIDYDTPANDGTRSAILCRQRLPDIIDSTLVNFEWNCARFEVELDTPDGTDPVFTYENRFALPDGTGDDPYCLMVLHDRYREIEWKVQGRYLLTNEDEIDIVYVGRLDPDTDYLSVQLKEAIWYRLAMELCMPLVGSKTLKKEITEEYEKIVLPRAWNMDSKEGHLQQPSDTSWVTVRAI
jgi:hypothetical protein